MIAIESKSVTIPALGFGTFQLSNDDAFRMVKAALNAGYTHIDTAQNYQNEDGVGTAIQEADVDRSAIFLTTKVGRDRIGKNDFLPSVEESLRKLKSDYVDLLLIHWPNESIPLQESIEELMKAQEKGYAKHIGVSNFTISMLDQALQLGANIVTNQVEYHPLINQEKLYAYLLSKGIVLTAYSPIAQGDVIGNETLKTIGEKYGKNEIQITLRWLIQQDGVVAIPRSSKEENMESNLQLFDFKLDQEDIDDINKLKELNKRVVNPSFAPAWD
jgi:2,5-diketo-D-gluconate reductase B